jgi:hypothetical protein
MFLSGSEENPGDFGQKRRKGFRVKVKVKVEKAVVSEMDDR